MRTRAAAVAALSIMSGAAHADMLSGLGATHVYGPVAREIAVPTDEEVLAVWPAAAKQKSLGGSAVMHCVTDGAGGVADCRLTLERSHAGFGQALLSLAPKYRLPAGAKSSGEDVVITATWPAPDTPVTWEKPPKAGDFATSATVAAWRAGSKGQAVMNCMTARMGSLHDCTVVYQSPAGKGFGTMALRFQGFLRLKPATLAGKPIESGLDIVFNFEPPAPGETP